MSHFDARLRELIGEAAESERCLTVLNAVLTESAAAEAAIVGLERLVRAVPDPERMWRQLAGSPRALEILVKVVIGSPYLTDILLREPGHLEQFTHPSVVGDLRSRQEFFAAAQAMMSHEEMADARWVALRRFQQSELLRIGVCDFLGLLDLRSVTNQLSLLADAIVQAALMLLQESVAVTRSSVAPATEIPSEAPPQTIENGNFLRGPCLNPWGNQPAHLPPTDSDTAHGVTANLTQLQQLSDSKRSNAISDFRETPNWEANDRNAIRGNVSSGDDRNASRGSDSPTGFAVLALGKLGGEELNYSSDIDLVFVSAEGSADFTGLAQRLSRTVSAVTAQGLLYRVDLRLRPWGDAGPLVPTDRAYLDYLRDSAQLWEKQALLKARVIAGDLELGTRFLESCRPLIFSDPPDDVRRSVWKAKQRIEQQLQRSGKAAGEVKLGAGTIRDIEFIVQCLQLQHGREVAAVRSINTLDGLVRLTDFGFVRGDEFRALSSAYVFFRVVEHALQLKHYRQLHTLPTNAVELETLARRFDFPDAVQLASHFQQHRAAVRRLFDKYVGRAEPSRKSNGDIHVKKEIEEWHSSSGSSPDGDQTAQIRWLESVSEADPLLVDWQPRDEQSGEVTIAGFDQVGDLSLMCGLLFVHGFDILDGNVMTEEREAGLGSRLRFANVFALRQREGAISISPPFWAKFREELLTFLNEARGGKRRESQARMAKRVSRALPNTCGQKAIPSPVSIEFDNEADERATVIKIGAEDTSGFLFELTNALALSGVDVRQMRIETIGSRVRDTLRVTDESGRKLLDPRRHDKLRATIVLIQHFTNLLPQSPDPEAALLHFQELLERELREPDWLDRLASLQQPEVLAALTKLLGVSDLFWEDFLRLQHANLFPVLTDIPGLHRRRKRDELWQELAIQMLDARTSAERRKRLNAFKDREMFRIDMRHLAGVAEQFEQFTSELSELAEVVISAACEMVWSDLIAKHGEPTARWCLAALGKLGGAEIGFASDIELLFLYDANGSTTGLRSVSNTDYFEHFVELFQQSIQSKSAGIFRIDLRLRPHGQAGNLAVSLAEFRRYFASDGPAWPFERQALIKLRPIAGDAAFGQDVISLRDDLLFRHARWDAVPVRAMRERQVQQHVQAGTFHAKLSPGALVDVEYLVQLLQLANGERHSSLRVPNTLIALEELGRLELVAADAHAALRSAYRLFRRLIDALRLLRGGADDLTLPPQSSEPFVNLARHLGMDTDQLTQQIEEQSAAIRSWTTRLGWPIVPA